MVSPRVFWTSPQFQRPFSVNQLTSTILKSFNFLLELSLTLSSQAMHMTLLNLRFVVPLLAFTAKHRIRTVIYLSMKKSTVIGFQNNFRIRISMSQVSTTTYRKCFVIICSCQRPDVFFYSIYS